MTATEKLKTLKEKIHLLEVWFEGYNDVMIDITNIVDSLEKKVNEMEISDVGRQELLRILDQWATLLIALVQETIVRKTTNLGAGGEAK